MTATLTRERTSVSFRQDSYGLCVADAIRVMEEAGATFTNDWLPALHTRRYQDLANFIPLTTPGLREVVRDRLRKHEDFGCRTPGADTLCAQELQNADNLIATQIRRYRELEGQDATGVLCFVDGWDAQLLPTTIVTVTDLLDVLREYDNLPADVSVSGWDLHTAPLTGTGVLEFECEWAESDGNSGLVTGRWLQIRPVTASRSPVRTGEVLPQFGQHARRPSRERTGVTP